MGRLGPDAGGGGVTGGVEPVGPAGRFPPVTAPGPAPGAGVVPVPGAGVHGVAVVGADGVPGGGTTDMVGDVEVGPPGTPVPGAGR